MKLLEQEPGMEAKTELFKLPILETTVIDVFQNGEMYFRTML